MSSSRSEANPADKILVIGVAGGTGSGKTTVSRHLLTNLGEHRVVVLQHDAYYKDQSHLEYAERVQVNYDHPDSLDNELLCQHVADLLNFKPVEMPVYDFKTHTRTNETIHLEPRPIVVVEGILIFLEERLRSLMGIKIFVDTDADLRFIRRLRRDVAERGRTVDSVIDQYLNTVRLMHQEFVEPTKRYADIIIPEGGYEIPALLNKVFMIAQLAAENPKTTD